MTTYKIIESQLVRLQDNRPETAVNLDGPSLKTAERYIAALDANPFMDSAVCIENELTRMLAGV